MSELETAKKRALYLLGGRDYSRKELFDKLLKNYSREICEAAVEQMIEYGYLDDRKYAFRLAKKYIEVRGYGRSRAKMMMTAKGLSSELSEEALEQYSDDDIVEEISAIIEKKYKDRLLIGGIEGRKEREKVMAALMRRGFEYRNIKTAIDLVRKTDDFDDYDENSDYDW